MKYLALLAFLIGGGSWYIHDHDPRLWKQLSRTMTEVTSAASSIVPQQAFAPQRSFVPPAHLPAQPHWTWTTLDGRTYEDVVIKKVEPDCVTAPVELSVN